jgi:hypothetical protein
MDYETKIQNGHKFIVGHFFKPHEIQIGSRWISSCGYVVTVEGLNSYGSTDPWYEVVYSWEENGVKKTHDKDVFSFQCRYCLIVEDT